MSDNPEIKFKLVLVVGPTGMKDCSIIFYPVDEVLDAGEFTHGEGQCFIFDLVNYDCSTNFHKALENGHFLQNYGKLFHDVKFEQRKWYKQGKKVAWADPDNPNDVIFVCEGDAVEPYTVGKLDESWVEVK